MTQEFDRRLTELIKHFLNDRLGFVRHIIGVEPTPQQVEALIALDGNDFVSIKSGVNTGKTAVIAWMILHYMCTRPHCKIVATSPSKDQLRHVLWPEILIWHNKMNPIFRSMFVWRKESYVHREHEEWFAVARTASKDNTESLQGIHAKYVFRIKDEASAIPEDVHDVLEGDTGTIETKELMCGNPTRLEGTFYRAFNKVNEFYRLFTWSSLDSPIAPKRIIDRIRRKFGEDSNMFRVRVQGEFPLRDGDSFIPFDLAMAALEREIAPQKDMPKVFGCDIARFGSDDTCIAIRQGDEFLPYHILKGKSTMEVARYIATLANEHKPVVIFVDVIGIGSGVYDRLEELGYPVIPVNVAETPAQDPQMYKRLRDELWGNMRTWLEQRRGKLWDNAELDLIGQLTTPKYRILEGAKGKVQIETKDEMKKRGVDSPNIADAAIMTFAEPVSEYSRSVDELYGEERRDEYRPLDMEAGYGWLMPFILPLLGGCQCIYVSAVVVRQ